MLLHCSSVMSRPTRIPPNAYDSLADGYAKAGNWKEAARASERAVTLATEFNHPNLPYFIEQAKKMNERLKQKSTNPK